MYVIRSALRASTGRPPARFVRGRRYPSAPRFRSLHTTRQLAQAANPPPTPGSTPADHNANKKTADGTATAEQQTEAAIINEDPDILAQKLQRSRETVRRYSAALRRQQRGKKADGLPPVHIPNWFLKRRVIRHEDQLKDCNDSKGLPLLSITLSHNDSGEHATCSIPAGIELDAPQVLARLVRALWGQRLDAPERLRLEKYLSERMELADETASPDVQIQEDDAASKTHSTPDTATTTTDNKEEQSISESRPSTSEDGNLLNAAKTLGQILHSPNVPTSKFEKASKRRAVAKARDTGRTKQLSPLIAAEIRATIAASLSTSQPAAGDSFPSTKTNVILQAPTAEHEAMVDQCVFTNALELGSDVIVLQALDLAQLAGDYLGEGPEPSPHSIRSLGYETYRLSSDLEISVQNVEEGAQDESETSQPPIFIAAPAAPHPFTFPSGQLPPMFRKVIIQDIDSIRSLASSTPSSGAHDEPARTQSQNDLQLEDIKIANLLEALIDANESKQNRGIVGSGSYQSSHIASQSHKPSRTPAFFDYSMGSDDTALELNSIVSASAKDDVNFVLTAGSAAAAPKAPGKSKLIYVRDFKELNATHYGGRILQKLEEVVRRRRVAGERIMIIGSTCSRDLMPELSRGAARDVQSEGGGSPFRTIVVTPDTADSFIALEESVAAAGADSTPALPLTSEKTKCQRINALHIQNMLRSLDPVAAANISDMDHGPRSFRAWASILSSSYFQRILTYDEVHRIALTALGLLVTDRARAIASENTIHQLNWAHVALALALLEASDVSKAVFLDALKAQRTTPRTLAEAREMIMARARGKAGKNLDDASIKRQRDLAQIAATASKYEKRLMPGIADPDQIKTTFDQVHVPKETVESLRTISSLSLLRPEAFSYGILATEKISGALLYGPPGTGKTLLAKAVAKESGSTVLEVSGSQIMDKYVGEGEKNVAAVFSLARKLSPCIVFLDEADAVFASRDAMRERTSHRDILNQFLKEWDGLNDLTVFVMVATNRPFDLDDAVIRRLPRRLLVDLPTQADRKEILRIHLAGEQLDDSVDLEDLAKRTPFYSGSDLKNVAVSAALACVKEENEQAALAAAKIPTAAESPSSSSLPSEANTEPTTSSSTPALTPTTPAPTLTPTNPPQLVRGQSYNFPEKRTLHARHFDKALQEISASISEDMSSLSAIKKFDDRYGDRKGNKRRKDFGFGVLSQRDDNAARVRI